VDHFSDLWHGSRVCFDGPSVWLLLFLVELVTAQLVPQLFELFVFLFVGVPLDALVLLL